MHDSSFLDAILLAFELPHDGFGLFYERKEIHEPNRADTLTKKNSGYCVTI